MLRVMVGPGMLVRILLHLLQNDQKLKLPNIGSSIVYDCKYRDNFTVCVAAMTRLQYLQYRVNTNGHG